MRYTYWVIDRLLAGRPGPTLYPWNPEELYQAGLRVIVSLAAEEPVEDLEPYGFIHYRAAFPPVLSTRKVCRRPSSMRPCLSGPSSTNN